ncbi:MAG: hypothetical protein DRO40_10000 [Thermoprotei archaeon]|nr:MAG: hypothetical protein DRO40_10000 [Thermoprotei archaeon]
MMRGSLSEDMKNLRQTEDMENLHQSEVWVRKGECKRCGKCCRVKYLFKSMSKEDKLFLKRHGFWLHQAIKRMAVEDKACPFLEYRNGVAYCKIYEERPRWCREYPSHPDELIEGCGYYFEKVLAKPLYSDGEDDD